MKCSETQKLFSAFIDGELDNTAKNAVKAHIATCKTCAAGLDFSKKYTLEMKSLCKTKAPEDFILKIRERIERPSFTQRIVQAFMLPLAPKPLYAGAAMFAVIIIAVIIFYPADTFRKRDDIKFAQSESMKVSESFSKDMSVKPSAAVRREQTPARKSSQVFEIMLTLNASPDYAKSAKRESKARLYSYNEATEGPASGSSAQDEDYAAEQKSDSIGKAKEAELSIEKKIYLEDDDPIVGSIESIIAKYNGIITKNNLPSQKHQAGQKGFIELKISAEKIKPFIDELKRTGIIETQSGLKNIKTKGKVNLKIIILLP